MSYLETVVLYEMIAQGDICVEYSLNIKVDKIAEKHHQSAIRKLTSRELIDVADLFFVSKKRMTNIIPKIK
jgi:hypothetical protein